MQDTLKAGTYMILAAFAFALNDTLLKILSDGIALAQLVFVRGVAVSVLLLLALWPYRARLANIAGKDWRLMGARAIAETATAYFFLTALFNMPIANAVAILQLLPLTVTLAAWLFLNEPLGWRRLSAIGVGFIGMLLIVRPGTEGFNIYTIYGLCAVGVLTVRELTTRKISQQVPSMVVTFVSSLLVCLSFGAVAAFEPWAQFAPGDTWLMALSVISITAAYFFAVAAMRIGDIAAVSPLRYSGLLFSLGFGLFVFNEWPDTLTFMGAVMIIGSGLFTMMRERQRARQEARVAQS